MSWPPSEMGCLTRQGSKRRCPQWLNTVEMIRDVCGVDLCHGARGDRKIAFQLLRKGEEMCAMCYSKQSHLSSPERGVTISVLEMEK